MQWEIVLKGREREFYVRDDRGRRPAYASFDFVSRDEPHTIAPCRSVAIDVAWACREYIARFAPIGLAIPGRIAIRAVQP